MALIIYQSDNRYDLFICIRNRVYGQYGNCNPFLIACLFVTLHGPYNEWIAMAMAMAMAMSMKLISFWNIC